MIEKTLCASILAGDWSEYEIRKRRWSESANIFDPSREWEVIFFVRAISRHLPIGTDRIRSAVLSCVEAISDRTKEKVIEHTVQYLRVDLPF